MKDCRNTGYEVVRTEDIPNVIEHMLKFAYVRIARDDRTDNFLKYKSTIARQTKGTPIVGNASGAVSECFARSKESYTDHRTRYEDDTLDAATPEALDSMDYPYGLEMEMEPVGRRADFIGFTVEVRRKHGVIAYPKAPAKREVSHLVSGLSYQVSAKNLIGGFCRLVDMSSDVGWTLRGDKCIRRHVQLLLDLQYDPMIVTKALRIAAKKFYLCTKEERERIELAMISYLAT